MRFDSILSCCLVLFLLPGAVPAAGAQQDPAIQLRQEMRQQQRQDDLRPAPSLPELKKAPALAAHPEDIPEAAPVLRAPTIKFQANGLLDDNLIQALIAPYQHLDLGKQRIALLLRQLNAQLVMHGLVTSRATVKRLDSRSNVLEIELVPGRIEAYATGEQPVPRGLLNAFPGQAQDLLILQDIEQGVQQIQRLRRYQAEIRILPGQSPSASLIDLRLTQSKPWWLQLAADNQGSRATGSERGRATLTLENTLGLLDSFGLTYLSSQRSEVAVASLAVPWGYNTWSASYAASRYTQALPADLQEKGGSYTATLAWNRVLHLSAAGRDMAELVLTNGDSWRRIDSFFLTPQRLSVLKASATRLRQGSGWRAWGGLDVSRGLTWFGATDDSGALMPAAPHAQFTKFEAHAGLIFAPANGSGQYTGQVDAQTSPVGLYGPELFRLGGMSTVRGYDEGAFAGDRGLLFRHEWQARSWPVDAIDSRATPLLFLDHGTARLTDGPATRLAGAGAGVRLAGKHWAADVLIAKPIDHSSTITANGWHFHATLRIDL